MSVIGLYGIMLVLTTAITWVNAIRIVVLAPCAELFAAPTVFRLWNIYHTFYTNFLLVEIQNLNQSEKKDQQQRKSLEKKFENCKIFKFVQDEHHWHHHLFYSNYASDYCA